MPKPSSPFLDKRPIQLIEVKARGRFGDVWRALFKEEEVAVKVFPVQVRETVVFVDFFVIFVNLILQ